jgi:uncharacterized protein (UPF0218 family)
VIDKKGKLLMPEMLRTTLTRPLGRILTGDELVTVINKHADDIIMTVGDMTSYTVLLTDVVPRLMIIDHKVNRIPLPELVPLLTRTPHTTVTVKSGPGFVSNEAIMAIQKGIAASYQMPHLIEVTGELLQKRKQRHNSSLVSS